MSNELAFVASAWNAIPHLVYLENAYLLLKRQLQCHPSPVASPPPLLPQVELLPHLAFPNTLRIVLHRTYLFYLSPLGDCTHGRL